MAQGQGGTSEDVVTVGPITSATDTPVGWMSGWYNIDVGDDFDGDTLNIQGRLVETADYKTILGLTFTEKTFTTIKLTGFINLNTTGAGTPNLNFSFVQIDAPIKA